MSPLPRASSLAHRIAADLSVRTRADEYSGLLRMARDQGYEVVPLCEVWDAGPSDRRRYLAVRHDVDIRDVPGNEMFRAIERSCGARASYYFRLSTVKVHADFIRSARRDGCEIGYHYEEASALAKSLGLRDLASVIQHREEVEARFVSNCDEFRRIWNPNLRSAASHGDWANRLLGFGNQALIGNVALAAAGLDFEACLEGLTSWAGRYVSDVARHPARWADNYGLREAVADGHPRIYMLTHERSWHGNPLTAIVADLDRVAEEAVYRLRRSCRP